MVVITKDVSALPMAAITPLLKRIAFVPETEASGAKMQATRKRGQEQGDYTRSW